MVVLCEARAAAAPARFAEERAQRDVEVGVGVLPVRARRRDREEQHAPVRRRRRRPPSSPSSASSSSSSYRSGVKGRAARAAAAAHRGDDALSRAAVARPGIIAHLAE